MHITLRQLDIFEAVARHLSFTRAAEELHLTQPAVSMQIKQLEDQIGMALFEQLGKKIFMTLAGNELYHYSRVIQQQLNEAEDVLEEIKGVRRGKLSIAVASTANYFVPKLLAAFSALYPQVTFSLDVTNREGLLQHIENNDNDLVIMGKPPDNMDLEVIPFMENPLVIIAAPNHPLVGLRKIPLKKLQRESFVLREQGSGTRIALERFLEEHGIRISANMEMRSNEGIKQSVEAGLGIGIVSLHTLALFLEADHLKVLDVEHFPIMRHWYMVHRAGKRSSPVAQAFKEFVKEESADILDMPRTDI
jgi:DNA-binding transcriptional LysR family regulator